MTILYCMKSSVRGEFRKLLLAAVKERHRLGQAETGVKKTAGKPDIEATYDSYLD